MNRRATAHRDEPMRRPWLLLALVMTSLGAACMSGSLDTSDFSGFDFDAGIGANANDDVVAESDAGIDSGDGDSSPGETNLEVLDDAGTGNDEGDVQEPVDDRGPWVELIDPAEESEVSNPVWFQFTSGGGVVTVEFHCDDWPLQDAPIPATQGEHTYSFIGVNRTRTVILTGYDSAGAAVASDTVSFVPSQPAFDCTASTDTGYVSGDPFEIELVTVLDKPVELQTANAFWAMREAALADGVEIRIVSGFRTNAEQQYLYNCYINCNCNNCNLAARPGYSNHQSGHALDLNTGTGAGVLTWLNAHGADYGFERTVPSESWHWEWWGGGPGTVFCPE